MIVSFVLFNLSTESISLKNATAGFLDKAYVVICEIITSTASELLTLEVAQEQSESAQQDEEGKFI